MLKSVALGVLSSLVTAVAALFLFAFICVGRDDPSNSAGLIGVSVFVVSCIVGSAVSLIFCGENSTLCALFSSLVYSFLVLAASFINRGGDARPLWQSALICLISVCGSLLMGFAVQRRRCAVGSARKKLIKSMGRR